MVLGPRQPHADLRTKHVMLQVMELTSKLKTNKPKNFPDSKEVCVSLTLAGRKTKIKTLLILPLYFSLPVRTAEYSGMVTNWASNFSLKKETMFVLYLGGMILFSLFFFFFCF